MVQNLMILNSIKFMLQDSCSPLMFYISSFHDHVMVIVIMIISMVMYILLSFLRLNTFSRFFSKSESLEIFWVIIPIIILSTLAIPSLYTLYIIEEIINPTITIKIIGHQWYWSYEYEDFESLEFDSFLIPVDSLQNGEFRLLEVDKTTIIPCKQEIRLIVSSADVIHSWTVPSMGVKVDAVPGRLNLINLFSNRTGLFFGQCSEICGSLHAFMPICLESIPLEFFFKFIKETV